MSKKYLYLPLILSSLAAINPVQADVAVSGLKAEKLFGDMRMRFERTDGDTIVTSNNNNLALENTKVFIGKTSPVFMHSSELLFRDDIALEGIQANWSKKPFNINVGHIILEENKNNGESKCFQIDYKLAKNLKADLRWYSVDNLRTTLPPIMMVAIGSKSPQHEV